VRTAGTVLLIGEEFEQARVIAALLISVAFLAVHLTVQPLRKAVDGALMALIELALVLVYVCCGDSNFGCRIHIF
jgi:hypothetical protein